MSKNIKDIGKKLLGQSLNSFHRKTGLTQLEKNNEMQDGILDGILSQVDDAYIEKTEQSNVIHLDGSGDGVVVLDSIEGNTMVNIVKSYDSSNFLYVESQKLDNQYFKLQHSANENSSSVRVKYGNHIYKPNTTYTLVVDIKENTANVRLGVSGINSVITKFSSVNFSNLLGQSMITFVTKDDFSTDARGENPPTLDLYFCSWDKGGDLSKHITFRYWILEGDWTDKEIPPYFEGLQSSFEEKVNSEGKHEIEILSRNQDRTKQNKLKLLINEPLRSVGNIKDRLVSKDNKLVVERYCSIREYQEGDLELENTLSDMTNTIYLLDEICYEEVTNEYGEPILLEGYENGTLYIDSTIIPTTTVKYTQKMESFKTYKEVKAKNAINDFDVTNNVIPYMMEVDIKLTELEMSAISTYNIKNIRKMEVLDMISMQERTFKMLERLIRGKSHTKQEMIDRVLLYEQAKRITTEQALELNLVIEEVYGA